MKKISIIIPAKNEANYLSMCLRALQLAIDKWGQESEVILVDNGSTDTTVDIAQSKGCKVIYAPRVSIGALRNIGALDSKGEIIGFLDADCVVSEDWICLCLQNFSDQTIGAVGTRAVPDLKNCTWVERGWYYLISGAQRPDFVEWLGTSNLFITRKVFQETGGFDENLISAEDVDLCKRINSKYKILLEKRINTIHLRESKTIPDLFQREYTRGKSGIEVMIKNRQKNDIISLFVPMTNLLAFVFFLASLAVGLATAIPFFIFILLLPLSFMFWKKSKPPTLRLKFQCYIIAAIYLIARSCSLISDIISSIKNRALWNRTAKS